MNSIFRTAVLSTLLGIGVTGSLCAAGRPDKAIVVTGLAVHERAEPLVLGEQNTVRETEEDFPF